MSYIEQKVKETDLLLGAIRKWGRELQIEMAIEECSELIHALQKLKRDGTNTEKYNHVCEEVADVDIMIQQLKFIFSYQMIEEYRIIKLERLEKRIADEKK